VTNQEDLLAPKSIYPRHFGIIFTEESDWDNLLTKCEMNQLSFYQPARLRFPGKITEHKTFFLQDPFYNLLEFKYYRHYEAIFGASQFMSIGDR
jgi:extradiol dioxygenase family protein